MYQPVCKHTHSSNIPYTDSTTTTTKYNSFFFRLSVHNEYKTQNISKLPICNVAKNTHEQRKDII